ncbi:hypothetical protein C2S52_016050 [Perilla frutescens var. hirtella]|nr:hypothetical protein C2S52_016050 [Perilla frutescens var. hirtella]
MLHVRRSIHDKCIDCNFSVYDFGHQLDVYCPVPSSFVVFDINAIEEPWVKGGNDAGDSIDEKQPSHVPVPNEILKNFDEIRALHLRLPCHGNQKQSKTAKSGKNSTTFFKWRAEFGRELHGCVILGAKYWAEKVEREEDSTQEPSSRVMADDELKLRIVWTISCLIAASARHYLM